MHITNVWWTVNGFAKWRWKVKMGKKKKIKGKELTCLPSSFSHKQFSRSVVSNSLRPHGLQHARLPCLSPTPGACSNSCPSSQWCHPTISSSVIPFSFCLQSFPASGSFPMSQLFASGGQSIGASPSALVLPMNIQDWFPLGLTGLISLQVHKQYLLVKFFIKKQTTTEYNFPERNLLILCPKKYHLPPYIQMPPSLILNRPPLEIFSIPLHSRAYSSGSTFPFLLVLWIKYTV